jgi:hypothetical protein
VSGKFGREAKALRGQADRCSADTRYLIVIDHLLIDRYNAGLVFDKQVVAWRAAVQRFDGPLAGSSRASGSLAGVCRWTAGQSGRGQVGGVETPGNWRAGVRARLSPAVGAAVIALVGCRVLVRDKPL